MITGVGMVTPLGSDAESTWAAVLRGDVGRGPMPEVESPLPAGFDGGQAVALPAGYREDLPREARYLRNAIEQAVATAGLKGRYEPSRCAVVLGTTLHGIRAGGRYLRRDDPGELKTFLASATAARAIEGLPLCGGAVTTCSACSSSLQAIIQAALMLRSGECDCVIAGGYDAVSEYVWAGFHSLGLVAKGPLRPFCKGREGMKVSEGYAVVALERASDARARGARVVCALAGWGDSSDAHHLTQPHPDGEGALAAMRRAAAAAGVAPAAIGFVAAHATGTRDNDASERNAISRFLGADASAVPVVGFKSLLGHTLGAAGAVELILSALAMRARTLPGCANVAPEDVEYPELSVRVSAKPGVDVLATLNTSLGFGGANACAVLTPAASEGEASPWKPREVWITGIGYVLPGGMGTGRPGPSVLGAPLAPIPDEWLASLLSAKRMRRFSGYVKHSLAALTLAVRDAGLDQTPAALRDACAFLGTTHGSPGFCMEYYAQIVRDGMGAANPVLFAEGVPNAAAAHVSTTFGVRGCCQTVIGSRCAGLDALAMAAMRIRAGECSIALVCAAEESHGALERAYASFGLAPPTGLEVGHGGLALVLEAAESAGSRGRSPCGTVARAAGSFRGFKHLPRAVASGLERVGPASAVWHARTGTWIDRAERAGLRRGAPETPTYHCEVGCELFSIAPLAALAAATGSPGPSRIACVGSDWNGGATVVCVQTRESNEGVAGAKGL
ncbi:MAG: beta-ketoacyl synthase N-terminal-like domain-containing protein [Phycisphaerales bacterium]